MDMDYRQDSNHLMQYYIHNDIVCLFFKFQQLMKNIYGYDIKFCGFCKIISLIINYLFAMMDKWNEEVLTAGNNGKHELRFPTFQQSNIPLQISNSIIYPQYFISQRYLFGIN